MQILVINAGSSSLKYQLIDMENESVIAKGNCERIGTKGGKISHKTFDGRELKQDCNFPTHVQAFEKVVEAMTKSEASVIESMNEISAVGHRIVQGAELFAESTLVNEDVIAKIEGLSELAPLHNPAHIQAIRACQRVLDKNVPQVVVFDTAFHQTMPQKAFLFGVPFEYYEKYHIRRYGFHGTSHRFVSQKYAQVTGRDLSQLKIVTCHLGNGSSICAVNGGKSVDTSMGFTPLDGLLMGTRSGSVDPSVVLYLSEKENLSPKQMSDVLNKTSGFLGISGFTSDHRDLVAAAEKGEARAQYALDLMHYQVKKYIGSYAAAMNGLDAVVFTGGIGENASIMRKNVCSDMDFLGLKFDETANEKYNHQIGRISSPDSKVDVWIIPTNEELLIARDTLACISK